MKINRDSGLQLQHMMTLSQYQEQLCCRSYCAACGANSNCYIRYVTCIFLSTLEASRHHWRHARFSNTLTVNSVQFFLFFFFTAGHSDASAVSSAVFYYCFCTQVNHGLLQCDYCSKCAKYKCEKIMVRHSSVSIQYYLENCSCKDCTGLKLPASKLLSCSKYELYCTRAQTLTHAHTHIWQQ